MHVEGVRNVGVSVSVHRVAEKSHSQNRMWLLFDGKEMKTMKRAVLAFAFLIVGVIGAIADCGAGGNGIKSAICNGDGSVCCVRFCDGTGGCF